MLRFTLIVIVIILSSCGSEPRYESQFDSRTKVDFTDQQVLALMQGTEDVTEQLANYYYLRKDRVRHWYKVGLLSENKSVREATAYALSEEYLLDEEVIEALFSAYEERRDYGVLAALFVFRAETLDRLMPMIIKLSDKELLAYNEDGRCFYHFCDIYDSHHWKESRNEFLKISKRDIDFFEHVMNRGNDELISSVLNELNGVLGADINLTAGEHVNPWLQSLVKRAVEWGSETGDKVENSELLAQFIMNCSPSLFVKTMHRYPDHETFAQIFVDTVVLENFFYEMDGSTGYRDTEIERAYSKLKPVFDQEIPLLVKALERNFNDIERYEFIYLTAAEFLQLDMSVLNKEIMLRIFEKMNYDERLMYYMRYKEHFDIFVQFIALNPGLEDGSSFVENARENFRSRDRAQRQRVKDLIAYLWSVYFDSEVKSLHFQKAAYLLAQLYGPYGPSRLTLSRDQFVGIIDRYEKALREGVVFDCRWFLYDTKLDHKWIHQYLVSMQKRIGLKDPKLIQVLNRFVSKAGKLAKGSPFVDGVPEIKRRNYAKENVFTKQDKDTFKEIEILERSPLFNDAPFLKLKGDDQLLQVKAEHPLYKSDIVSGYYLQKNDEYYRLWISDRNGRFDIGGGNEMFLFKWDPTIENARAIRDRRWKYDRTMTGEQYKKLAQAIQRNYPDFDCYDLDVVGYAPEQQKVSKDGSKMFVFEALEFWSHRNSIVKKTLKFTGNEVITEYMNLCVGPEPIHLEEVEGYHGYENDVSSGNLPPHYSVAPLQSKLMRRAYDKADAFTRMALKFVANSKLEIFHNF